ncbi:MAG: hypothetical protein MZU97_24595 [Bacillus subtilis]|nr:hypothetical protein [Bacillus subtilis]
MNPARMTLSPDGSFAIRNVTDFSYLYFPLFNTHGMLSVISPEFQGDVKTSQNHFLTQPVSVEDLRHALVGRHLFFEVDGVLYSNTGKTPVQKLHPDHVDLEAGILYHRTITFERHPYGYDDQFRSGDSQENRIAQNRLRQHLPTTANRKSDRARSDFRTKRRQFARPSSRNIVVESRQSRSQRHLEPTDAVV